MELPRFSNQSECEDYIREIDSFLHSEEMHPHFEYDTTTGPRKAFDDTQTPEGDGWIKNKDKNDGWERFEYHEEAYWLRKKV